MKCYFLEMSDWKNNEIGLKMTNPFLQSQQFFAIKENILEHFAIVHHYFLTVFMMINASDIENALTAFSFCLITVWTTASSVLGTSIESAEVKS